LATLPFGWRAAIGARLLDFSDRFAYAAEPSEEETW
jgi:hypothetical protein